MAIRNLSFLPLLLLAGCAAMGPVFDPRAKDDPAFTESKPKATLDPALLKPPTEPYRLGPGDILRVEISELKETISTSFVTPDGMFYYDLAGSVKAENLTVPELTSVLKDKLKPFYRSPNLSVSLVEVRSKRYWILGTVAEPGIYPLTQPTTVLDSISQAKGSLTSRASGTTLEMADFSRSLLIRKGEPVPVDFEALVKKGDMTQNVYLQSGDFVYLPSITSQEIYVLGAVKNPRAVGLSGAMGVVGALADAGGPIAGANFQNMLLIRGSLTKPKVAVFNYNDLVTGHRTDFLLQPGDVIWVPNSPWQRLEKYLDSVLSTVTRTIAANEGSRASEGTGAAKVGTSISVGNPTGN
jgi:protein involved in polysaccharide export with SLBB domain